MLRHADKDFRLRYAVLTFSIFVPLLWSFALIRNVYPFTAWNMMMSGGSLERPWTYYIVRGETASGELIDLRPSRLTDGLYGRTWSMVAATINNDAFRLRYPHPQNAAVIARTGPSQLPRGIRVPELLRAWGNLHNEQLAPSSPLRLKAVRIDVYRWESGYFGDYDTFIETWRQEL
jgi:hypothetical protein